MGIPEKLYRNYRKNYIDIIGISVFKEGSSLLYRFEGNTISKRESTVYDNFEAQL